jgi:hypothetical protein
MDELAQMNAEVTRLRKRLGAEIKKRNSLLELYAKTYARLSSCVNMIQTQVLRVQMDYIACQAMYADQRVKKTELLLNQTIEECTTEGLKMI